MDIEQIKRSGAYLGLKKEAESLSSKIQHLLQCGHNTQALDRAKELVEIVTAIADFK